MTVRSVMGLIGLCGVLATGCGSTDGGSGGSSGTGGSGSANNCGDACSVITSCTNDTTASCMAQCEGDLMDATEFSPACGEAVNDLAGCVGGLSCEQLDAWFDELPADSYPCVAEETAIDEC
jgi:hypothetical protein